MRKAFPRLTLRVYGGRRMFHSIYQRAPLVLADLRMALARSQGQALIEYALIISLIAVVAIAALSLTGVNIKSLLTRIAGEV